MECKKKKQTEFWYEDGKIRIIRYPNLFVMTYHDDNRFTIVWSDGAIWENRVSHLRV